MKDTDSTKNTKAPPITANGKRLLEKELKQLVSVERPIILEAIDEARALGDLKENAEYHAAKERQAFISARMTYIKGVMASSEVIEPTSINVEHIAFGATVTLLDLEKDKSVTYQIVGIDESDIKGGKISIASPIARALVGKGNGDEISVRTPKGNVEYEIEAIKYV